MTWIVPRAPGLPRTDRKCGIDIVRVGRGLGHLVAAAAHVRSSDLRPDLVIDQVNAYPMFTPIWFRGSRLVLIHHLVRGVWFRHMPLPFALVGFVLERSWLRPYRREVAVTVSRSTRRELLDWGFSDVRIVPNAVESVERSARPTPPERPHYVTIGRLVPAKRVEHVLRAFAIVRRTRPDAELTVIGRGRGTYAKAIARMLARTEGARLVTDADEATKWRILSGATAVVATSAREGWGLAVSEGHAVGTPSIAYDVPGLRDSTEAGVDGLICRPSPPSAAAAMLRLANDERLWARLSTGAGRSADRLTPQRLKDAFVDVVSERLQRATATTEEGEPPRGADRPEP